MSDFFDGLARTLATPMPRSRAVRSIVTAVAVTAVPGLRAGRADARGVDCPSRTKRCFVALKFGTHEGGCYYPQIEKCCVGPNNDAVHPNLMSWVCGKDEGCGTVVPGGTIGKDGTGGLCVPRCTDGRARCGRDCCERTEECVDGECSRCDAERQCGSQCCPEGAVCRNRRTGLCCVRSWKQCSGDNDVVRKCCPPNNTCCFNHSTNKYTCCDHGMSCVDGICKCKKGEVKCGTDCCKKGEHCSNGLCCPKGKINCGGKCCDESDCCGKDFKTCCSGDTVCLNGTCCPLTRGVGSGKNARCCPPGTVPTADGSCCPPNDPECCDDGDTTLLCRRGSVCVQGVCREL